MLDHSSSQVNFSIEEVVTQAYLQVTLKVTDKNGEAAAGVYTKSKAPSLTDIAGAESQSLLNGDEDVQVLHGFSNKEAAEAYLNNGIFSNDVAGELGPLLDADLEIRIYEAH